MIDASFYLGASKQPYIQQVVPISLKVVATPVYASHKARQVRAHWWDVISSFLTTTLGIIISIGAAGGVIAGAIKWISDRKKRPQKPKEKTLSPATTD